MSAATDKTNLAELRRTMTLWHNRVTALGFDGVSDLIALAETGGEEMKKAWPIGERVELKLMMIKKIGEGSTTANSLPHVARIAEEALQLINTYRAGAADESKAPQYGAPDMHRLTAAIAKAYGYLWCVNCEPGTPRQYSPEKAAYAARKELRDLLTKEQRGAAINAAVQEVHETVRQSDDAPIKMVFAGTTGSTDFLDDDNGNRRFWPVSGA